MEEELKQLKTVLRSLVVSSPTQVDVRTLMRDYRAMMGQNIPLAKYGCREPVSFLREHFSDCFLFQGVPSNPVLTLIVPDSLKHIDQFVQKQKVSSTVKMKGKRRSVPQSMTQPSSNLIATTFTPSGSYESPRHTTGRGYRDRNDSTPKRNFKAKRTPVEDIPSIEQPAYQKDDNSLENGKCSDSAYQNFLKKRMPLSNSLQCYSDKDSDKDDNDSGRLTSSSTSSTKILQLEKLKKDIVELIEDYPEGVWCTDLLRLFRSRYGRELNFSRFGFTSVLSIACSIDSVAALRQPSGDWRLAPARAPPSARPPPPLPAPAPPSALPDPDDALPGVAFEADVFPEDCMHFMESIPSVSVDGVDAGCMLEVMVGEVYSPSHFWLIRLGEDYNIAMENLMDEMNEYYSKGEGRSRQLAAGAVRAGHYCASCYDGDWHRSLIVQVLDSDTVKVRHVDYGTVERCASAGLRALRRCWGALPAQAARARLAGVRPPAAGRRWPHAAAARFLRAVRDVRLVANVVARDTREDILEVLLIDTSSAEDRCIGSELVRAGHADPRADPVAGRDECYLYPRFEALETGATPNFGDIHAYLRDGIALDLVADYARHVPPALPPAPSPAPEPPRPALTSVPLLRPDSHRSSETISTVPNPQPAPIEPRTPAPPTALVTPCQSAHRNLYMGTHPYQHYQSNVSLVSPYLCPAPGPATPPVSQERPSPPGQVTLSASDCEIFTLLCRVDAGAAQRFMMEAIGRALAARPPAPPAPTSALNPHAAEFRLVSTETPTDRAGRVLPEVHRFIASAALAPAGLGPPPGFENS